MLNSKNYEVLKTQIELFLNHGQMSKEIINPEFDDLYKCYILWRSMFTSQFPNGLKAFEILCTDSVNFTGIGFYYDLSTSQSLERQWILLGTATSDFWMLKVLGNEVILFTAFETNKITRVFLLKQMERFYSIKANLLLNAIEKKIEEEDFATGSFSLITVGDWLNMNEIRKSVKSGGFSSFYDVVNQRFFDTLLNRPATSYDHNFVICKWSCQQCGFEEEIIGLNNYIGISQWGASTNPIKYKCTKCNYEGVGFIALHEEGEEMDNNTHTVMQEVYEKEERIPEDIFNEVLKQLTYKVKNEQRSKEIVLNFFYEPMNFERNRYNKALIQADNSYSLKETVGDFYEDKEELRPEVGINGLEFWINRFNCYSYREMQGVYELTAWLNTNKPTNKVLTKEEVINIIVKHLIEINCL